MSKVVQIEYVGDLAPYDDEAAELAAVGAEFAVVRGTGVDEVVAVAADADVIWLEWTPHLTREVLERLPQCGLVLRWGVGYDQIDVAAATELGIAVGNAPSYCTIDVAEHAFALLLSLSRNVVPQHEQLRAGQWRVPGLEARRFAGTTVGVVGLGRIGRRVAALCAAAGAHVIGHDPLVHDVPGVEFVDFDQLLTRADHVSIHVPLSNATRHLIRAETLARMKPDAVLVNTSRGAVVDQSDLAEALRARRIAAAALDVFEQEPLAADDPIRELPNAVLTPHQGAFSAQSMRDLRREIVGSTIAWLTTGWTDTVVNPQVRDHPRIAAQVR